MKNFFNQTLLQIRGMTSIVISFHRVVAFIALATFSSICFATNDYIKTHSISLNSSVGGWVLSAYQMKEADYGVNPAKFCIKKNGSKKNCHLIIKRHAHNEYPFQIVTELTNISNQDEGFLGVLVKSEHTGTVDGLTAIDIWRYDEKDVNFVNILPHCVLAGAGGYRLITHKKESESNVVLITAERLWQSNEVIDGAHKYKFVVYKISKKSAAILDYVTSKYYGGEDADVEHIIDAEIESVNCCK